MCRHKWELLIPKPEVMTDEQRIDFFVEVNLRRFSDIYYCSACGKTGHKIKSHRSGIRVHYDGSYFKEKGNELRQKYGLPQLQQH